MSFFANTTGPGLAATSTPAKPTGFGNFSFGNQQSSTATSAFGAQAAPSFGAQPAPGFGTQAAPSFGAAPAFGSMAPATQSNVPQLGGFTGFGASNPATNTGPSLFGGLGTGTATSGFGGFGTTTTTSSAPIFSGFGNTATSAPNTAFGGFGTSFASGFGNKPQTNTPAPAFGGFAANTGFGLSQQNQQPSLFGQQQQMQMQQQLQQQQQINPDEAFAQAIFNVSIYGDERDTILTKWNYLQAMWGTGKAYFTNIATQPPAEITTQNYLCRFKTMGYSRLPGKENKMGLVSLFFNKKIEDVLKQKDQIIQSFSQIFGNKPNLQIIIDSIKPLDNNSQVIIYVQERSMQMPNEIKRILATEVCSFLNQAHIKTQLANLGIEKALALILPDEDQLKLYLATPPKGIDPRMWRQAKIDNPDAKKFLPVPMIGFHELKWRIKCQENETEIHIQFLNKLENDLSELKQRHAASTAKITEHRRKLAELTHKILKIVVKQECTRKVGVALSPEEEVLRTKLENMQALVSAPTQFKGRLSELLSQMRMRRHQYSTASASEYTLDRDCEDEMKTILTMHQNAMKILINTVNKDLKALNIITEGMAQLTRT